MAEELKDQRIIVLMTPSEVKAIDDWSFSNRIRSRGDAIRRLCQLGLAISERLPRLDQLTSQSVKAAAGVGSAMETFDRDGGYLQDTDYFEHFDSLLEALFGHTTEAMLLKRIAEVSGGSAETDEIVDKAKELRKLVAEYSKAKWGL